MVYTVHPAAEKDVSNAMDFYKAEAGSVVAARFLAEFERVASLVDSNPQAGAPITSRRRTFHLKMFPYSVIYRVVPDGVQIMIVRHQHRRPSFGMGRR